jgi:hypothetical protein
MMEFGYSSFRKFVFTFALVIGILMVPPIFERLFAMVFLLEAEKPALWFASILMIVSGLYCLYGRWHTITVSFLLFNILLLISLELGARSTVKLLFPYKESSLARRSNWTYDELRVFQGHPFIQFIGIPSKKLVGNRALGNLAEFNNFGFVGKDFSYTKPQGVIRIASVGASTTASGYPAMMEDYLNARLLARDRSFEVMNFGLGYYTSAHTMINFLLNVVDFSPDYVVIHQGWNDWHALAPESDFRGDYSHHLKAFEPPRIIDRYIVRVSVIYRTLKFFLRGLPEWVFVESATRISRERPERMLNNRELATFQRNIETIIDIAMVRQIKVVLTTMPHTTDEYSESIVYIKARPYIKQYNEVMRAIAKKYEPLLFVDLNKLMTGKVNQHFVDVGHLDDDGKRIKAEHIGRIIAEDLRQSGISMQ